MRSYDKLSETAILTSKCWRAKDIWHIKWSRHLERVNTGELRTYDKSSVATIPGTCRPFANRSTHHRVAIKCRTKPPALQRHSLTLYPRRNSGANFSLGGQETTVIYYEPLRWNEERQKHITVKPHWIGTKSRVELWHQSALTLGVSMPIIHCINNSCHIYVIDKLVWFTCDQAGLTLRKWSSRLVTLRRVCMNRYMMTALGRPAMRGPCG